MLEAIICLLVLVSIPILLFVWWSIIDKKNNIIDKNIYPQSKKSLKPPTQRLELPQTMLPQSTISSTRSVAPRFFPFFGSGLR